MAPAADNRRPGASERHRINLHGSQSHGHLHALGQAPGRDLAEMDRLVEGHHPCHEISDRRHEFADPFHGRGRVELVVAGRGVRLADPLVALGQQLQQLILGRVVR